LQDIIDDIHKVTPYGVHNNMKLQSPFVRERKAPTANVPASNAQTMLAPMSTETLHKMLNMPIDDLAHGRLKEADLGKAIDISNWGFAIALAQYYPQDWGYFQEYADCFNYVSECAFAIKLKKRLMWKRGLEITASSEVVRQRVLRRMKERKVIPALKQMTVEACKFGTSYAEIVDNSVMGTFDHETQTFKGYVAPTQFYGLKVLDSRSMRAFVNQNTFDVVRAEQKVDRFVQRYFSTYSMSNYSTNLNSNKDTEINLHVNQVATLRFNRNSGQWYGDSMFRDSLSNIRGYLIMMHYLPAIVEKRAYPLLHVKMGLQEVKASDGRAHTYLPTNTDFLTNKAAITSRMPNQDIFTDILTTIEQVYQNDGGLRGIQEYIQAWKERLLIGIGIPTSLFDLIKAGTEIKWGDLKFQTLIDEINDMQGDMEQTLNDQIMPALVGTEGGWAEAHFNQPTSQDFLNEVDAFLKVFYANMASREWISKQLHIPESALEGTMYSDVMAELGQQGQLGAGPANSAKGDKQ
jgi:hypothetical protein